MRCVDESVTWDASQKTYVLLVAVEDDEKIAKRIWVPQGNLQKTIWTVGDIVYILANLKTAPTAPQFGFEKRGLYKIPVTITDVRVSTENEYSVQDNINQLGPVHPENWVDELMILGTDEDGPDSDDYKARLAKSGRDHVKCKELSQQELDDPPVVFKTYMAKGRVGNTPVACCCVPSSNQLAFSPEATGREQSAPESRMPRYIFRRR
jgi:hypothetical protein